MSFMDPSSNLPPHLRNEFEQEAHNVYRHIQQMLWQEPSDLYQLIHKGTFLAGGALTCIAQGNRDNIKDYDLFCHDYRTAQRIREMFEELGQGQHGRLDVFNITERAISFTGNPKERYPYIQIITKWHGKPDKVVSRFDWIHCMAYVEKNGFGDRRVWAHKEFVECAKGKILRLQEDYPHTPNQERQKKFVKRGYHLELPEERGIKLLKKVAEDAKKPEFDWADS
jgi:hypothetical protein